MLLHYWKLGHFILYNQQRLGWGSKFIERTSEALRKLHPEKKGYSPRNLTYMCQFAKLYPVGAVEQLIMADQQLAEPTPEKISSVIRHMNELQFGQEPPAQIQETNTEEAIIGQQAVAQLEDIPLALTRITQQAPAQLENVVKSLVAIILWQLKSDASNDAGCVGGSILNGVLQATSYLELFRYAPA
jgi:hypothetical protein